MPEYLSSKNRLGKIGISQEAVYNLSKISAEQVNGVEVNDKRSSCRFYGQNIKVTLAIKVASGLSVESICQQVKEEVSNSLADQLDCRLLSVNVVSII